MSKESQVSECVNQTVTMLAESGLLRTIDMEVVEEIKASLEGRFPQAAANKAAEEGELLHEIKEFLGDMHAMPVEWTIAQSQVLCAKVSDAIAADRAARPVANKAEVEPVGEVGTMPGTDGFTMACFKAEDVPIGTKLYATPPATTGAMPKDLAIQCLNALDVDSEAHAALSKFIIEGGASTAGLESILDMLENAIGGYSGGPFDKVQAIIDELRAVPDCGACPGDGSMCKSRCKVEEESPASTVLTDERIKEEMHAYFSYSGNSDNKFWAHVDDIVLFAQWVAAQAGQVTVPEWFVLMPIEPTDAMMDAPEVKVGGCYSCSPEQVGWHDCAEIYRAMLAAAPSPAKESK